MDKRMSTPRDEVIWLLEQAVSNLKSDSSLVWGGAAWRMADALGLLGTLLPDAMGIGYPTGRGWKIAQCGAVDDVRGGAQAILDSGSENEPIESGE